MVGEMIRSTETGAGASTVAAHSYEGALHAFDAGTFDIAFFDYFLGPRDGLSLMREVRRRGIETPIVVLTGHGAEEVAVEAMKSGAADYLSKAQLSVDAIARALRHALALAAEERSRRLAQAAVRASEERFRALVENSSDVLLLIDADGTMTYLTPSSQRCLGWSPEGMLGRSMFELVHTADRGAARAQIDEILTRPGASVPLTLRIAHADGSWRSMEGVGVNRLHEPPVGAVVINARDVTDERRLELELRQSHKMEAVGRLAGGVAHDFNNLLTAILGYCNLMLDDVPKEDPLRTDLEEIRRAGQRAAALTQQLLAFSRRQMLQPQLVDVNGLVQQLEKMLRRLIGDDIELETRLAAGLDMVNVDPASVEQVLVNLALNARDAMPRGGRLAIETAGVELDAAHADSHPVMAAGRYVMIAVADSGRGMDESTRTHVFEPFFTTKPQGQGDGLGLATVYGIVKQSGGYIWVFSEPERGTTFKVYFPPAEAAAPADI
jgi:hypothetical protein